MVSELEKRLEHFRHALTQHGEDKMNRKIEINERTLEELFVIIEKARLDIVTLAAETGEGYYPPTTFPRDYFETARQIKDSIILRYIPSKDL